MADFKEARIAIKVYEVEGVEGKYVKITYKQARMVPEAFRARLGKSIHWFVSAELASTIAKEEIEEEEIAEDQ